MISLPCQTIKRSKGRLGSRTFPLITRWLDFTAENVQARYNYPVKNTPTTGKTKGDPDYAEKLRYVMGLFQKLKR